MKTTNKKLASRAACMLMFSGVIAGALSHGLAFADTISTNSDSATPESTTYDSEITPTDTSADVSTDATTDSLRYNSEGQPSDTPMSIAATNYTAADFGGDAAFFSCITATATGNGTATTISSTTAEAITGLMCGNTYNTMTKVAGVNLLTGLKNLELTNLPNLASVDLTGNTSLESLNISYTNSSDATALSPLATLTLGTKPALKTVVVNGTSLTSIDLSGATAITSLDVYNNKLTALDVSKNTALTILVASHNAIPSIDLSKNTALTTAYLYDNKIETLDTTKINKNLLGLYLDDNVLVKTNFRAVQVAKGEYYYAAPSTNEDSGMFIPMIVATGLSAKESKITTSGAAYYGVSDSEGHCAKNDAFCIIIASDVANYQGYIQLQNTADANPTSAALGKDPTKRNYRLELALEEWSGAGTPDTGFFTGSMNGTTIAISAGAVVALSGITVFGFYIARRGQHRSRFNR